MLENRFLAGRVTPLSLVAPARGLPGGVSVTPLEPTSRFSLRLKPSPEGFGTIAGFRLDQRINRVEWTAERWSARLGPDEWLIGGPEPDTDVIQAEVEAALSNRAHALVDISHRNVAIAIAGPHAAAALNAGCPLDLHDKAFPAGSATRTLFGKAEIVLIRSGAEPVYRVECWRSFATYVHGLLVEATYGLGDRGSSRSIQ